MKKVYPLLISVLFCIMVSGCGHFSGKWGRGQLNQSLSSPPIASKQAQHPADFAGGPESNNRTGQPIHKTVDKEAFKNELYYHGYPLEKKAALTFDDGPDVTFTNEILNILKENGIKATFFIVGQRAKEHPEMVKRILDEGHVIGNHTWDHPKMTKLTDEQVKEQVEQTNNLLKSIAGYEPAIFRPPYGLADQRIIRVISNMKMKVIDWSVDTRDWAGTPPKTIMSYVQKEMTPGGIILEHCAGGRGENLSNTVSALPEIIQYLKQQGYQFSTIPELLSIPIAMSQ